MAATLSQVLAARVTADLSSFELGLKKANRAAERANRAIARRVQAATKAVVALGAAT